MFKTLATLWRGKQAQAAQALADAHALTLLDQQIRDALADLDRARRALALASAEDSREAAGIDAAKAKCADLEARALAALEGGREDLAEQAAQAIAALEADVIGAAAARADFARQIDKLRAKTADAERRLIELERGRRAVRAAEAVRELRARDAGGLGDSALVEAEATLKRLRERQIEEEAVAAAGEGAAADVAERLEAAGFGEATRPSARAVLERIKQRRAA